MAIEAAADLAGMFDADEFAVSATYTPSGGSAVSCSVLLDRPEEELSLGRVGVVSSRRVIFARLAEIGAGVARGDAIVVGGETLTINKAELDLSGAVWELSAS